MGFAIMRCAKMGGSGSVAAAAAHLTRERDTPNADESRKEHNQVLFNESVEATMAAYRNNLATLDKKPRKDAVTCVEYVFTFSPETDAAKISTDYFNSCIDWAKKRHGAKNIILAAVHRDETTDHLHLLAMPIREKEVRYTNRTTKQTTTKTVSTLDAKHWFDGSKKLSEMQTEFWKAAGRPYSLERGIRGSRARHQSVKRFYGDLEAPHMEIHGIPEKGLMENHEKYTRRVDAFVTRSVGKAAANLKEQIATATAAKDDLAAKNGELAEIARQMVRERDRARQTARQLMEERQAYEERLAKAEETKRTVNAWLRTATPEEFVENQRVLKQKDRERDRGMGR